MACLRLTAPGFGNDGAHLKMKKDKKTKIQKDKNTKIQKYKNTNTKYKYKIQIAKKSEKSTMLRKVVFGIFRDFQLF